MSRAELDALVARMRQRIGDTYGPIARHVEAGALTKFARATGQTDPLYLDETQGPLAAPTYISTFCGEAIGDLINLDLPLPMFLHSDDVAELGEPIRAGDTITASSRLSDVFLKEGGRGSMLFQTVEMTLTNQHQAHVATVFVSLVSF